MTTPLLKTLYTADATVTGGRAGHGSTSDGQLDVDLRAPKELGGPGGGTNPEQLFAVGYAACFQSALASVARAGKIDVSTSTVGAQVSFGPVDGGAYGLAIALDIELPGLDAETSARLVDDAHALCPYSNAIRGNVEVTLNLAEAETVAA